MLDRRRSRPFAVVLGLVAGLFVASCSSSSSRDDGTPASGTEKIESAVEGPNIVLVLLDDLDEVITQYWDALPQARALVADRGLRFTNAFAPGPICCPARASILTGKYPHNTGVLDNSPPDGGFGAFAGRAENDTVATRLEALGYRTGFYGKYLNGYPDDDPKYIPPGWTEWFAFTSSFYDGYSYEVNQNGTIKAYGEEPADYQTDVLAQRAGAFIAAGTRDEVRPFFLVVAPTAPHSPLPPAPRHAEHPWVDAAAPQLPNFNEPDVSDKPTWLREGVPPLDYGRLIYNAFDHQNRMASLLAADDMIAALVRQLEQTGQLANTYFVLTSDNGFELGSHRLIGKSAPYEESLRIPLVIFGPGVRSGSDERFVLHTDFAPTFLDLAAGEAPDTMDGRSIVPLFDSGTDPWRSDFLAEYDSTDFGNSLQTLADVREAVASGQRVPVPTYRAVRTDQYLYVRWYKTPPHEYELYDLDADPYQENNLLATTDGATQWAAVTDALEDRLAALASCVAASCR